jgi:hypothetical protein
MSTRPKRIVLEIEFEDEIRRVAVSAREARLIERIARAGAFGVSLPVEELGMVKTMIRRGLPLSFCAPDRRGMRRTRLLGIVRWVVD